jgi:hypothetical protein
LKPGGTDGGLIVKADVKSFVQSFARGMAQRPALRNIQTGGTDPEWRAEQVRQLGVEAVAKALRRRGLAERRAGRPAG